MSKHRCIGVFALLLCCAAAYADPFASLQQTPADGVSVSALDYRVVGTAILGVRTAAVVRVGDGQFRVVRAGDRIGNAKVVRITLDAVHFETPQGISRRPVAD